MGLVKARSWTRQAFAGSIPVRRYHMKPIIMFLLFFSLHALAATSEKTITYNFKDADIVKLIEDYSRASGQKIIVDPQVRGKATIFNATPITLDEAFNQLSTAMMINGLAFSKQGDTLVALQARSVQRNQIEVVTELPPLRPDKMVTWIVKLKNVNADDVNKQLRVLTSANGELVPYTRLNQLIISDYVSNLYRIQAMLKELDSPATATKTAAKTN